MAKYPKPKEFLFLNLNYIKQISNCKRFPVVPGIDAGFMKQCTYGVLTAIYEGAKSAGDVSMIRYVEQCCLNGLVLANNVSCITLFGICRLLIIFGFNNKLTED